MVATSALAGLRDALSGRPADEVLGTIARELRGAGSFLVTSHVNADGDAIGSAAALCLALRGLGKDSVLVVPQPLPRRYEPFVPAGIVEVADASWLASSRAFEWCVVVDTSEPSRTGELEPVVFAQGQRRLAIDHHPKEKGGLFDHHLLVPEAPAAATLVLALLDTLGVPLDREIARLIWLGLSTDTGWFRFANTSPLALRDAARLLEHGIEPEALYEQIYGSHRLERTRILGAVLSGLKSAHEGRLVWGCVRRRQLGAEGVDTAELDGVIDHLKSVEGVRVAALITEVGDGSWKVSLRAVGDAAVRDVAVRFGGGGHVRAAGFRFQGTLEELEAELLRAAPGGFGPEPAGSGKT